MATRPPVRVIRELEDSAQRRTYAALRRYFRDTWDGINEFNVQSAATRAAAREVVQPLQDALTAWLKAVAVAGTDFGRHVVEREIFGTVKREGDALTIDWMLANDAAAEWAILYGGELITGLTETTIARINKEVRAFVEDGTSIGDLIKRISNDWGYSDARAEMIAVTEVTRAYAEGNMTAWRESGIIDARQWQTNNDELVCPICGPLNGQVKPINETFDGVDNPPAHVRCRCWISPVVL